MTKTEFGLSSADTGGHEMFGSRRARILSRVLGSHPSSLLLAQDRAGGRLEEDARKEGGEELTGARAVGMERRARKESWQR